MPRTSYFSTTRPDLPKPALTGRARGAQERQTRRAWETVVAEGRPPEAVPSGIRRDILDSWQRSLDSGVNAAAQTTRLLRGASELARKRHLAAELRQAASSAFRRLEPHLQGANTILILADENGVIVDAIGDRSVLDAGHDIHLQIGGDWSEGIVGTNGIGTALKTGKPIYVHAAEHFVEGVQGWTCAGVPIRDPMTQAVIGVVDLSGPPQIFRQHNIALVLAAAREIEIALAEQQRQNRTQLLEAFLLSEHSRLENRVLLLDKDGRILFRKGLDGKNDPSLQNLTVGRKLLPKLDDVSDQDLLRALPAGVQAQGLERLMLEGAPRGAALFLKGDRPATRPTPEIRRIKPRRNVGERPIEIVGASPAMMEAIELAERAARANFPVLIQGETGVGKELFALLIHSGITGDDIPYVPVNCAAISSDLIGAELFGYVDGAFTGALKGGRPGKFEMAHGGVLCLDEIGDMPIELQPYLLRALEQRAIYRMGDSRRRPVDVRLVSMTNRDLRQEIERGKFRRDLFYRIGVVTIEVPPLRERGDDILALIEHFSAHYAQQTGRDQLTFAPATIDRLMRYQWPGNVRELRNTLQRVYLVAKGPQVGLKDLPAEIQEDFPAQDDDPLGDILKGNSGDLESIEASAIRRTLISENGNLTRVAAVLGISRPTLYRKLKQYRISNK